MCDETKDCTMCRKVMPCKAESKSVDMTICDQFDNFYPTEEELTDLATAAIPEDPIEPDYSGIEADKEIPLAVGDKLVLAWGISTIVGVMATGVSVEVDNHPGNPRFVTFDEIYA